MIKRYFIDTNILVYALTDIDLKKQKIAKEILKKAINSKIYLISKQIIIEYINTTNKFEHKINKEKLLDSIKLLYNINSIDYTKETLIKAIERKYNTNVSYFNCLIAETLLENNIDNIYTENTKEFSKFKEIKAINPFK